MTRNLFMGLAGLVWLADTASAQPLKLSPGQQPASSFEELKSWIDPGETVFVLDAAGREIRGRAASLSDTSLTLAFDATRRQFDAADVRRIDRQRRDSVRNGVLIGAVTGALAGMAMGRSLDSPDCAQTIATCGEGAMIGGFGGAFWGAIGGWIADAAIRKRETVYVGPVVRKGSVPVVP